MKPRGPRTPASRSTGAQLGAAALDAHPLPTVIVDGELTVVAANRVARRTLGVHVGVPLGDALGCVDATLPGGCGAGVRCADCAFRRSARRAISGETVRDRGFVMRGGPEGDFHLIARAGPLAHGGAGLAILALDDVNDMLRDPGVLPVCEGCGRVKDEEGGWHPLHRYLEDRLGIESAGPQCEDCAAGGRRGR